MTFLDFTLGDNAVNIFTRDTISNVSITGSTADIIFNGYNFSLTGSHGAWANIEILPLLHSNIDTYSGAAPIPCNSPFELGFSVQDKGDPYTNRLLYDAVAYPTDMAISFDHLYLLYTYNIHKISSIDASTTTVLKIGGSSTSISFARMALYNKNTAYVSYVNSGDDPNGVVTISSVDLCGDGETIIYEYAYQPEEDVYVSNSLFLVKHVYNGEEVIVQAEAWSTPTEGYKLHVVFYSITNNEITDLDLINLNDTYNLDWFFSLRTPVTFYNEKVIFTAGPDSFDSPDPDPLPTTCVSPTFIIDINSKTVTRVDDQTIDTSDTWSYIAWGNFVDRENGYYYYFIEDYSYTSDQNALARIDLSANTTSIIHTMGTSDEIYLMQGDTGGYGRLYVNGVSTSNLISIPTLGTLATIDADATTNVQIVDEKNSLVWFYDIDGDRILGYSTSIGGTNQIYSISSWSPYTYAGNHGAFMLLIAGKFFIHITSRDGVGPRQYTWYVLNFDVVC